MANGPINMDKNMSQGVYFASVPLGLGQALEPKRLPISLPSNL